MMMGVMVGLRVWHDGVIIAQAWGCADIGSQP